VLGRLLAASSLALLLVSPLGLAVETAGARSVAALPFGRSALAVAADPRPLPSIGCPQGCAYLFGGTHDPGQDGRDILRFSFADDTVSATGARLPAERHLMAAAWSGSKAYLFGGVPATDEILEYSPETNEVHPLPVRLPQPSYGMAAAQLPDGGIYLFGGRVGADRPDGGALSSMVLRFDPTAAALVPLQARLQQARFAAAIGSKGADAFIVGGFDDAGARSTVERFNATTGAMYVLPDLAQGLAQAGYASDGTALYLLGGYEGSQMSDRVVRLDYAQGRADEEPFQLPFAVAEPAAAWAGDRLLLFGGRNPAQSRAILEVVSSFPPPSAASASTSGTGVGASTTGPAPGGPPGPGTAPILLGALLLAGASAAAWALAAAARRRRARKDARPAAAPGPAGPQGTLALRVEALSVQHRGVVVQPVSFDLPGGSLALLLGPSGAGKSSLLRAVVGLLPSRGRLSVHGRWLRPGDPEAKAAIGYVPQELQLYTTLSALDNVAYFGAQFGLHKGEARDRGRRLLAELGLEGLEDRPLDTLSGGEQRRVSIAVSMVHAPALLVLDEPTSGLDLGARRTLWMVLQRLAHDHGVAVLASSHALDDAAFADQVGIMVAGWLAAMGPPRDLIRTLPGQGKCVEVEFEHLDEGERKALRSLMPELRRHGVEWLDLGSFAMRCFCRQPKAAQRTVPEVLHAQGFSVRATRLDDVRIEDVFGHAVAQQKRQRGAP
jgi:ABC-type multidrug transport system ATPase subunit